MIRSLRHGHTTPMINTDVCIIGGGTAGLLLATQLRRRGLRVVVLEAGDATARRPSDIDHACEQRGIRYRGADMGRAFGLGGTTALWGGQLIPLLESDFDRRPTGIDAWPIPYTAISSYFAQVCHTLGLDHTLSETAWQANDPVEPQFPQLATMSSDFLLRVSAWLPFASRNFAKVFHSRLSNDESLLVWLGAHATEFDFDLSRSQPRITAVTARGSTGQQLVVHAACFVVCAGALESTRLLLAMDEKHGGIVTAAGSPLGRYFSDHLSVRCGEITCHDWRAFNLAVAPCFTRGVMRTPRLELAPAVQRREHLTSAFAHFTFLTDGESGFDLVRNLLRRRQGEQQPLGLTPSRLARLATDVTAMTLYRYAYGRLWIPRTASLVLQVDIEQAPNFDSRVFLGHDRDSLGRRRLVVDWRITPDDERTVAHVTKHAIAAWNSSQLARSATMRSTLSDPHESFDTLYDVYHPTGLIRMGSSPRSSVVDPDLRLWGTANCYVSSTAVFPSAGSANPGLTHLALTMRLADHLATVFHAH